MRKFLSRLVSTIAILGVLLAGMPVKEAHAASIVVNTNTDKSGLAIFDGLCGLREAVNNANYDNGSYGDCAAGSGADTITFADHYTITLTLGQLNISSPIIINGDGWTILQPKDCNPITLRPYAGGSVDCAPATWRIFEVAPGAALTLNSMRLRYGNCVGTCSTVSDRGGAIYVNGGALSGDMLVLNDNKAGMGGGLYNNSGTVNLTRAPMAFNRATSYGGAAFSNFGSLNISNTRLAQCICDNIAQSNGGGIFYYYAAGTLNNVDFHDNSIGLIVGGGGAMFNEHSNPTIQNSTFSTNQSVHGSAIYNLYSNPVISSTVFNSNTATNGGQGAGMYNEGSSPSLTNVVFLNNDAVESLTDPGGHGGGIYNDASSPVLGSVTFNGNSATESGGAMYNTSSSSPSITNATFQGNTAGSGGAIYNQSSTPTLTNVTVSGNSAGFGGGIYNFSSNAVLKNVVLWGDEAPSGGPELYNLFSTPTISNSVIQGGCALPSCTNIITADPLLQALASNGGFTRTMALGAGSPAIDAGTNTGCPGADQRGITRPQGQTCDIGAYEVDYFTISGNAGIGGTSLGYVNNGAKTATANGSGDYSLGVPRHWTGTVTPSKAGYSFSPTNRTYSDLLANQTGQNYTATLSTYTISGNAGVAGAVLSYENGGPQTASADGAGAYSFPVPAYWDGTVTPSKNGCSFTPTENTYGDVTTDMPGEDYGATCVAPTFLITGNAGVADAVLSYEDNGPKTATSDANGDYGFTVPEGWSGTVAPSKSDLLFTPVDRSYSDLAVDQLDQDFVPEKQTPTIASVFPAENSSSCLKPQVGVDLILAALVRLPSGAFNPASVTLKLDGATVTGAAAIGQSLTQRTTRASILYTPPANLNAGAHNASFIHPSPGGPITYSWSFSRTNVTCQQGAEEPAPDTNVGIPAFDAPTSTP
jgi:predicted outer membrane repeat protein